MEDMTEKELITVLIDKYTDLQRIKRANNGVENQELEYQIKVTIAKLASLGVCPWRILRYDRKRMAHVQ